MTSGLQIVTKSFPSTPFGHDKQLVRVPYIPIFMWGYGKMTKETPTDGLCTSLVASCTCIIFHCTANGRTILTHSPNYMVIYSSIGPCVRWVRGEERMPAIEVVVLRGWMYGIPKEAAVYGHSKWMDDFNRFMNGCSCRPNIFDCPQLLTAGCVLVDKGTARITILSNSNETVLQNYQDFGDDYLQFSNPIDVFVGNFLNKCGLPPNLHLQYDVSKYNPHMPIPTDVRLLLRSKIKGEPKSSQVALLRCLGMDDWIMRPSPTYGILTFAFNRIHADQMPCERCNLKGSKRCAACHGAWYCSAEHQKEDWKVHKFWCRANAIIQ